MGARLIYSALFEDEYFTTLPILDRLLWIGLFTVCADDQGRMLDSAMIIRSKVFPADEIALDEINQSLARIASGGKIIRYKASGKDLIQIANWWKYQRMRWAGQSKYPAPDGWTDRIRITGKGRQVVEQNWASAGGFDDGDKYLNKNLNKNLNKQLTSTTTIKSNTLNLKEEEEVNNLNKYLNKNLNKNLNKYLNEEEPPHHQTTDRDRNPADVADRLWRKVKPGAVVIPMGIREQVIPLFDQILAEHGYSEDEAAAHIKPFYDAWCKRMGKNGKPYSPNGVGWLDWLADGKIPDNNGTIKGKQNTARQLLEELKDDNLTERN